MRIALKVEVTSLKGMEQGVPRLLELFETYQVRATFFFDTAITNEGGTLRKAWSRTRSLLNRPKTPDQVNEVFSKTIIDTIQAGHEAGLLGYNCSDWNKKAAFADADWTRHQLALAMERFEQIVGHAPKMFSAANCQVNPHLLALEGKLGFSFASDTRGKFPFYPLLQGVRSSCPQIPVTLPTLKEALSFDGVTIQNVHEYIYAESRHLLPAGHVYMLNAEQEGLKFPSIMEKLLVMWKGQEGSFRAMGDIYKELNLQELPCHQIGWGTVDGNPRHLAMQSIKEIS